MKRVGRRFGKQKDANHAEIADAFRGVGLSVYEASDVGGGFTDLVVGGPMPCPSCSRKIAQNKLVEIKTPSGRFTPEQTVFHAAWKGPIIVVRTLEEALAAAGVKV